MASCPAGAEKLSANNQVARLPYTLSIASARIITQHFDRKIKKIFLINRPFCLLILCVSNDMHYYNTIGTVAVGSSKIVKMYFFRL